MARKIFEFFICSHHIFHKSENYCGVVDVWEKVNERHELSDLVRLTRKFDKVSLIAEAPAWKCDCLILNFENRGVLRVLGNAEAL
jgi:hypothetical protein